MPLNGARSGSVCIANEVSDHHSTDLVRTDNGDARRIVCECARCAQWRVTHPRECHTLFVFIPENHVQTSVQTIATFIHLK